MTRRKIRNRIQQFLAIRSMTDLAVVLQTPVHILQLQSQFTPYSEFIVSKQNGGNRHIEEPNEVLKKIQKKLNTYLQAIYFKYRTKAAYGFMIDVKGEYDRTIVSNARQHLSSQYLINMDFTNFFHAITEEMVKRMFYSYPFQFVNELSDLLADLCCYKGRLPMGAPSSPVLTNLYCIDFDLRVTDYMNQFDIRYTRFVDDMTFSGDAPIKDIVEPYINQLSTEYGLSINQAKTKRYAPGQDKIVTGIIVNDHLEINPLLITETEEEIDTVRNVIKLSGTQPENHPYWLKKHKQKIRGYVQFMSQVLGKDHQKVKEMRIKYHEALHQPKWLGPQSWSELPSTFI